MSVWLAPVLAQVVALGTGDRTEARVRVDQSVVRYDAESLAWASLGVKSRRAGLDLGYAFLLSGLGVGSGDQELAALHNEYLGASFRLRRTFVSIGQSGSYGERNFRSLSVTPRDALARGEAAEPPASSDEPRPSEPGPREGLGGTMPPPEAQPILIDEAVRVGALAGGIGLTTLLSRRLEATGYAGYDYSGGLDELSRLVYPVYYGPFGSAGVNYRLGPSDGTSTHLTGRLATNFDGEDATIATLEQRWSHRWDDNLETELGAGIAAVDSDIAAQGPSLPPYLPVGWGALAYRSRIAFEISVTTATLIVTPGLDRLTGVIDERAELRVEQRWTDGDFEMIGTANASQSLTSAGLTLTSLGADGLVAWHVKPPFAVETGFRMFWQKYAALDPLYAYALFVAFRVSTK